MRYGASLLSAALFLFWSLILSPFPVFSQGKARFYTLQESIEEALANNYSFKAKQEQVDQAMQAKKQARADFFPKLSTRYSYTRFDEERTFRSTLMGGGEVAISSLDNYEWRGTVTQPLFTGFALISSFELAKLGIDQSEMDVELVKLDLALKVKEAYFDILIADKAVEVAKDAVESLESHVKVARSFYKVGMIPVNDVLKAEVELANAKQNLVKANNASRLARSAFNIVLSRPINALVEVEDILLFKPERGEFPEYVREALNNRPEMKLIDISILQTDQQIRLANSKNFPKSDLLSITLRQVMNPACQAAHFTMRMNGEPRQLFPGPSGNGGRLIIQ
jgi:outer membrane protein